MSDEFYRVNDIAKLLKVSLSLVYRLVERGELQSYRIGGAVRISKEQLEAYLDRGKKKARKVDWASLG